MILIDNPLEVIKKHKLQMSRKVRESHSLRDNISDTHSMNSGISWITFKKERPNSKIPKLSQTAKSFLRGHSRPSKIPACKWTLTDV